MCWLLFLRFPQKIALGYNQQKANTSKAVFFGINITFVAYYAER